MHLQTSIVPIRALLALATLFCLSSLSVARPFDLAVQPLELDTADQEYVIRFQNTGNLSPDFVVIRNRFSAEFDIATLKILAASHPYTWHISGDQVLEFRFDEIDLPGSITNKLESYGYIVFTVKPSAALPLGTTIQNRAVIDYDFTTAPAFDTEEFKEANVVLVHEPAQPLWIDFSLIPNKVAAFSPVMVEVQSKSPSPIQVHVFGAGNKRIQKESIPSGDQKLYLNGLAAGSYFVQVRAGNLVGVKLLTVE